MGSSLNVAIAAEFDLCEKVAEFLEQSSLNIEKLSIVEIYPFSEEQGVRFNNKAVAQLTTDKVEWSDFNYLFFAGDFNHASLLAQAAETGCVVIDMKGICSPLSDVPVVVPTVNNEQLVELRQRNIVSLPDPQVSQLALALRDITNESTIHQLMVSSLQPASYVNAETVSSLVGQTAQLLNGIPLNDEQQRLAFDVFPAAPVNLTAQLQKVFSQLDNVVFHQIQVPVFYGLAQMVSIKSEYELNIDNLLNQWNSHDFIQYHNEKMITPVINGEMESNEQIIQLHISNAESIDNGVQFWLVADEQRFTLAFLAVKLVELIYEQGY
ncbi:oxidoreductase [Mannheimia massilioguelmaensis]|uniref:oxidoreductase n=1 Tax=Mannheimia massilioguelmaensis TaxID=1604354 RepID=UPI0005CA77C6|nr:oxidoreductase [Mannheimia massilioguelmaensis]